MPQHYPEISIESRRIARSQSPYVIAEMSANHGNNLEHAKALITAAKHAGADAVKLQTYSADTITLDSDRPDFLIEHGPWAGQRLYDLYDNAHLPWEWHEPLFVHARNIGITLFSSPFDRSAVDLLDDLGAPAFKVASFEIVDLPLIEYIASKGKPIIISTGMASQSEIEEAVNTATASGCTDLALLQCVSAYPAKSEDYNLLTIPHLEREFSVVSGLSDHTLDNTAAIASVALGASIVEKHFTLDRSMGGPDDGFSIEPDELKGLCRDLRKAHSSLGRVKSGPGTEESSNIQFRRSLYFTKDLQPGEIIKESDIKSVRPGFGLPPKCTSKVVGSSVAFAIERHTPVRWEHLSC